jgi:dihydroorotase/N-acyl-D-amino-acid deacylase
MNLLLLRNGSLLDGTGAPASSGEVLVRGDRIVEVGRVEPPDGARVVDCTGLTIAPGFIDAHSHSDLQVLEGRREKILQGVTTEVVGNCGFSTYPAPEDPALLREFANGILRGDGNWGWPSAGAYLEDVKRSPTAHVVSLVGHGSLRIAVAGHKLGALSAREVDRMEGLLGEALSAGAAGLSTGLMYAPGSSSPLEELERLCRVVTRYGKIYTSHIRSYFADLVPAIDEQIDLARRTGCRLQISHLQAVGASNWSQQEPALDRIERARHEGIDVAFDCYPYIAGSTVLTQLLPQWALEGGIAGMLTRLGDLAERRSIASEVEATIAWRWSDILISAIGSTKNQAAVGHTLVELAEQRECEPVEAMIDLLIEEQGAVNMLSFNQKEENLRKTLTHPLSIVISDGFYVNGRPHPRLHGTFPCLLGTYCRDRGWLSLENAVHKITGAAAERFNIADRGRLAPGYIADITVFDAATVGSPATYEAPEQPPAGIRFVFRNGALCEGSLPA